MKYKRTANQNLLFSLIKYNGLSLEALGRKLNPSLKKSTLSRICNPDDAHKPEHRIEEISRFFHIPSEILFPYEEVKEYKECPDECNTKDKS